MQKLFALVVALGALCVAAPARAQPNYPGVVKDHLGAVRKPPCKVCHQDGITGLGTVQTSFGIKMFSYGLRAYDEDSVRNALDLMALNKVVSAERRKDPIDVDVLRAGGDPNDDVPIYIIEDPKYGCGGATIAAHDRAGSATFVAFGLALLLARRRRRARAPIAQTSARSS